MPACLSWNRIIVLRRPLSRAANSLIEKNREQIRKEVFSENDKGEPITVFNAYSDVEEGEIVANKIAQLRTKKGYFYDEFAVLYRTNAQSRIFEEALRKRGVPYRIYGGLSFYQRKEIKDVIAYFRLAVNPNDEEAFKRVINYPSRGIGDTTVNKVIKAATENNVSLWTVLNAPIDYDLPINSGTAKKLTDFREMIERFIEQNTRLSPRNGTIVGQGEWDCQYLVSGSLGGRNQQAGKLAGVVERYCRVLRDTPRGRNGACLAC
mgnify:CR=1 FL=1